MHIVITPAIAGKPWDGATIYEQSLGGSESAVVYLAREFARRGHKVRVYSHGRPGTFEQVEYFHVNDLTLVGLPECDVHISSRWPEILNNSPGNVRVLWLHDMPQNPNLQVGADLIVALSQPHAAAWGLLDPNAWDPERLLIEGDGVDTTLFTGREVRDTNRLIWASNPDRGLYLAAKIFREQLLPRWPDLKLHVYGRYSIYGWPEAAERPFLPPSVWMRDGSIVLHDSLPRLALARQLMSSWCLWYPTFWPETYCMMALEAQCAGTPVVTTPVGSLPEVVKGGIVTMDLVNAISQLRNAARWKKLSTAGQDYAALHSWAIVAAHWETAIGRVMGLEG